VPEEILQARALPYASPDLEDEFFALYSSCEFGLQQLLSTRNDVAILSGEGMLALWGALKSTILPGDRVLSVSNGVFGHGIAEMARQCGATVELVAFPYDQEIDVELVREAAVEFQPQIITAVHCETPSGVLNPLDELGALAAELDALFIVDVVASAAGVPVLVDDWHIDLGLLGSQKCLSLPPDLSMVSISEKGWERIRRADYNGYDALLPFRSAQAERLFPYTHNWHALAGLQVALQMLEAEGIEEVYRRHVDAMETCGLSAQWLAVAAPAGCAAPRGHGRGRKLRPAGWRGLPHWAHGGAGEPRSGAPRHGCARVRARARVRVRRSE
jgi:aspartate aminotransferase-like enzyme